MDRNITLLAAFAFVVSLGIGVPTASAQSCGDPATTHAADCTCLPGFHATDRALPPDAATNPCVADVPTPPLPVICVLPDGTTRESARRHCRCPAGTTPHWISLEYSEDRLASIVDVPDGHRVMYCASSLAPRASPDSVDSGLHALEEAIPRLETADREAREAIEAWCGTPTEDQSLADACRAAIAARDAPPPTDGTPVDLSALTTAIETLRTEVAALRHDVDTATEANARQDHEIRTLSTRMDTLAEGDHRDPPDPSVRREAERIAGETARREVANALRDAPGDAFIMGGMYGLVSFNPLEIGGRDYGLPWQIGADLTLGIALGGGWNVMVGGGVGGTGADIPGVSNVAGQLHIGFASWIERWALIGFGGTSEVRFLPDGLFAQASYGGYGDFTIRLLPRSEWTPVATFRGFVGVTPRGEGNDWHVEPDGGVMLLFGIAHFPPERTP